MSTGNDNFITLDNIAEIQDIVSGDYLFTISNGVIYKLDFQNFIITKENTDFFTTLDSLSAQVVSNTQSLCAINAYLNGIKPTLNNSNSTYTTLNELSGNWQSTYTTINTLSSQAFLPISTDSNNIAAGSMIYYNGETSQFTTLPPGFTGESLVINNQGLPSFSNSRSSGSQTIKSDSVNILSRSRSAARDLGNFSVDKNIIVFTADTDYAELQINFNTNYFVTVTGESTNIAGKGGTPPTFNVTVRADDSPVAVARGVSIIRDVSVGTVIRLRVIGSGVVPQQSTSIGTLNYTISGLPKTIEN